VRFSSHNLYIGWLSDTEAEAEEHLTEPEDIAAAIIGHLEAALDAKPFAILRAVEHGLSRNGLGYAALASSSCKS
jgi:hypothetical protein